jgi:DNA helicase-2/ATP-dependent DNA helicase PcrA
LDEAQERIAAYLEGGLLVLAPVGTGKTLALTERVARALESGFEPRRMLCLTFTNRAAQELLSRLTQRLPRQAEQPVVKTFHGLCTTILRSEAKTAGLPSDFTICDEEDSIQILQTVGVEDTRVARDLYYEIGETKSGLKSSELHWPMRYGTIFARLGAQRALAERYQRELELQSMLDFNDLVLRVNALFVSRADVRERWSRRFDFVQVDEVQDTHRSEYRLVYVLARRRGNLALFGDVDQTIYGWRGSDPDAIIAQFNRDFAPVTQLSLAINRRATRRLVEAAEAFASSFADRRTSNCPAASAVDGEPVWMHTSPDVEAEARWIGEQIQRLRQRDQQLSYRSVGVLTGNNHYGTSISQMFEQLGLPHLTIEGFEFFRRQEVKDALAFPRLVVNPESTSAMLRVVQRTLAGVSSGILNRIRRMGAPLGLRLVDLLRTETFTFGDPFGRLIEEYRGRRVVVLDVETTGLSALQHEDVEIAATRLEGGQGRATFHAYLQNSVPVGASESIHTLTDRFLAEHGRPPADALAEFFAFCRDDLLVGHNVGFDLRVVASQARRLGIAVPDWESVDTLQLAQRHLDVESFSLHELAQRLELEHRPTHHAPDDVAATCDLLGQLVPLVERGAAGRRALIDREAHRFAELAERLESWRELAAQLRPRELLARMLEESGLLRQFADQPPRLRHLEELLLVFGVRDDPRQDAFDALCELLRYAALARNIDHLDVGDDRVPIVTIHQAKGLEFDTVFIAGLADGELPRWRSVSEGRLDEERRLFYVALTRARQRLYLSHAARKLNGKPAQPSPFLELIAAERL